MLYFQDSILFICRQDHASYFFSAVGLDTHFQFAHGHLCNGSWCPDSGVMMEGDSSVSECEVWQKYYQTELWNCRAPSGWGRAGARQDGFPSLDNVTGLETQIWGVGLCCLGEGGDISFCSHQCNRHHHHWSEIGDIQTIIPMNDKTDPVRTDHLTPDIHLTTSWWTLGIFISGGVRG